MNGNPTMDGRPGNERNIRPKQVPDNRQRSSTAQTGLLHSEPTGLATVSCAAPHFHKTLTLRSIQNTPDLFTPLQQPEKITQYTKVANYLKYAKTHRSPAYCCREKENVLCQRHAPATPYLTVMSPEQGCPKHPKHAPHWHGAVVIAAGAAEIIITFAH